MKLDSWAPKLDEYACQYNSGVYQGLFGLSPSEVFFGRKANENIEYIQNICELCTPSVSKKSYAAWKERVKNLRKDAEGRQLSRDKMIFSAWKQVPTVSLRIRGQSVGKDENIRQKDKRKT